VARGARRCSRGQKINETEGRAVLHTALRNLGWRAGQVDGQDVMPGVRETLARMERVSRTRAVGRSADAGGRRSPMSSTSASAGRTLARRWRCWRWRPTTTGRAAISCRTWTARISDVLKGLDPATTLVIVASKTFTTIETMTNAETARLDARGGVADPAAQFAGAVLGGSTRPPPSASIPRGSFGFEDWVGGRYSVWGPIGLSLMIAMGPEAFRAFLAGGGQAMDRISGRAWRENLPVMLALVGHLAQPGLRHTTRAVLPYDQRLARLPAYLQQLEMESNGKRVAMDGSGPAPTPGPWSGASRGPTASTPSTSSSIRARGSCPANSWSGAEGHEGLPTSTAFSSPIAWRSPRRCCGAQSLTRRGRSWRRRA
jgi:glucose-6-phosphate isomerase